MVHGVHPVKRKKTHYSTRSFGATQVSYEPFSLDAGFGFPDQNADGHPEGCTWYTQNELCQDQDKTEYDRDYVRRMTLSINGQADGPCDIEDSLKAVCVYGVKKPGEPDDQAHTHARGRYFMLEKEDGMDWFDSAIAVMQHTRGSLSIASPWFPVFENAYQGVMPSVFPLRWPSGVPGHDHKVYGLTSFNGAPVLTDKSWQGTHWGTGGVGFWGRAAFNALMDIPGTGAFLVAPWDGSIQTIRYGILYRMQILIRLYSRQLSRLAGSFSL